MDFVNYFRKYLFILSGVAFVTASCSIGIEKRRYNKGYHVSVSQKPPRKIVKSSHSTQAVSRTVPQNEAPISQSGPLNSDAKSKTAAVSQSAPTNKDVKGKTAVTRKANEATVKSTSFILEKNPDSTYSRPFIQRLTNSRKR